jgi:subfamily B ATP-binding cassette protein MsbA
VAIPLVVRTLLDTVLIHKNSSGLNRTGLILAAVILLSAVLASVRSYLVGATGEKIARDLRVRLYAHLLHMAPDFYDNRRTGDLLSQSASDTALVQTLLGEALTTAISNVVTLVAVVAITIEIDWRLAVASYVIGPFMAVSFMVLGRKTRRLSRLAQEHLGEANAVLEETLSNISTVLSFRRESYELGRYRDAVGQSYEVGIASVKLSSVFSGFTTFIGFGAFALLLWLGTHEVIDHRLTPGGLIAFLYLVMLLANSLQTFGWLYATLSRVSGGIERVMETLNTPSSIVEASNAISLCSVDGTVTLEDVCFTYRSDMPPVLRGVTFRCAPGERVALVGVSGAGKSTIVKLLQRFYDTTAGTISIDGTDVRRLSIDSLRGAIGTVMQDTPLFGGTVRENIAYGQLDASDEEIRTAARLANAHEFIERLPQAYDTTVGDRGVKLSGGQRQRVAIARAMLKNAPILVLDEATSSLDIESEALVYDALERLMAGRTTIVITHRLSTAREADSIVVLDGGRVVEIGRHDDLVHGGGVYARLYSTLLLDNDRRIVSH